MGMALKTDDFRIESLRQILPPSLLIAQLSISEQVAKMIICTRREIVRILNGKDDRLLVVVGPCSVHDPVAALDYANRLSALAKEHRDDLLIVMRAYFEKPRTTVGWKGLVNDPGLDDGLDINRGVYVARELLLAIAELGLPVGIEFLNTITPQFFADLVSWGSIGARTCESQVHRELASGLSMPVGFKNGTGGSVQIAVDAVCSARHPHHFPSITKEGVGAIVDTRGNNDCHIILRGGRTATNYDEQSIAAAVASLTAVNLSPRVMVDCSHGNSGKNPDNQLMVIREIAQHIASGNQHIMGVMMESFIEKGRQDIDDDMVYGQSVTDACIGWSDTVTELRRLAGAVARRRHLKNTCS